MDKLTKAAQDHGEIFEMMTLFKKAISEVADEKAPEHVSDLNKFFNNYIIPHFQYEEEKLFPIVFKDGTLDEKGIVRGLQQDHIRILEKVDRFKDLVSKYGTHSEEGKVTEISNLGKEIIEETIEHARHEDTNLFPLIKKYD